MSNLIRYGVPRWSGATGGRNSFPTGPLTSGTTSVTATVATTWVTSATVAPSTRGTTWATLAVLAAPTTRLTTWVTRTAPAVTRATAWTTLAAAAASRGTTWNVAGAITSVTTTRATTWTAAASVISSRLSSWNTLSNLTTSTTTVYPTTTTHPRATWTRTGNTLSATGRRDLPAYDSSDGFALGTTKPTWSNSGCRIPQASLTQDNTTNYISSADGQVISGLYLPYGRIEIRHKNVTVRDCIVNIGPSTGRTAIHGNCGVVCASGYDTSGWAVEYVTVDPINAGGTASTFTGTVYRYNTTDGGTTWAFDTVATQASDDGSINGFYMQGTGRAWRCAVRNVTDGFCPDYNYGGVTTSGPAHIWGCYIQTRWLSDGRPDNSNGTHNDGIQFSGQDGNTAIGNAIVCPPGNTTEPNTGLTTQGQCIVLTPYHASAETLGGGDASQESNTVAYLNWFSGSYTQFGSWLQYSEGGPGAPGIYLVNNRHSGTCVWPILLSPASNTQKRALSGNVALGTLTRNAGATTADGVVVPVNTTAHTPDLASTGGSANTSHAGNDQHPEPGYRVYLLGKGRGATSTSWIKTGTWTQLSGPTVTVTSGTTSDGATYAYFDAPTGDTAPEVIQMQYQATGLSATDTMNVYIGPDLTGTTPVTTSRATSWNNLVPVSSPTTRATTWTTSTTAATSRATTWVTKALTSATRATTWNVVGTTSAVSTTRGTTWVTRALVNDLTATTWTTKALTTATRATTWAALASASATRATSWTTSAAVAAQRATVWAVLARAGTITRPTTFNVAAAVFGTRASTWTTYAQATASRLTTWNTAGALTNITTSRATTWVTKAQVNDLTSTTWTVTVPISSPVTRATTWVVRVPAAVTRATTWVTRALVNDLTPTTWTTLATSATTRATTWATLTSAAVTRSTLWAVGSTIVSVTTSRATSWAVIGRINVTRATTWLTAASVATTRATTWGTLTSAALTRATTWATRASASATRATTWAVKAALTVNRATTWATAARTAVSSRATTWAALTATPTSRSTTWTTRTRVTTSRSTSWNLDVVLVHVTLYSLTGPTTGYATSTGPTTGRADAPMAVRTTAVAGPTNGTADATMVGRALAVTGPTVIN